MYVTAYTRSIKRRGATAPMRVALAYKTKSLTPMHERIRSRHPGAQTWRDPSRVILNFAPGFPLVTPIVVGGTLVA